MTAFASGRSRDIARSAVRGHLPRLRAGDRRAGGRRPDPGHHLFMPSTAPRSRTRNARGQLPRTLVRFVTDQISLTRDKDNQPVAGDRRCDGNSRHLDVRAVSVPRSGVAPGVRPQRVTRRHRGRSFPQGASAPVAAVRAAAHIARIKSIATPSDPVGHFKPVGKLTGGTRKLDRLARSACRSGIHVGASDAPRHHPMTVLSRAGHVQGRVPGFVSVLK